MVRLSLSGHSYTCDGVALGLAKQAKPNNEQCLQPVEIKSFKDKLLCPVDCIRAYESITSNLRTDGGIDEQFKAHSTRAASAMAAATSSVSTKEIMSREGWSNEHTFTKFYYRPKAVADYGGTTLQACKETC